MLWKVSRQYYEGRAGEAWSSGDVPYRHHRAAACCNVLRRVASVRCYATAACGSSVCARVLRWSLGTLIGQAIYVQSRRYWITSSAQMARYYAELLWQFFFLSCRRIACNLAAPFYVLEVEPRPRKQTSLEK